MEIVFAARVGQRVADLKQRVLVALVGLDGKVECVVSLGAVGNELDVCRQAAGPLRSHVSKHRIGRQNDLKRLRAGLRHRRAAGVVHKVALVHAELSVLCLDLQNVGVDGDSLNLGRHIVHRTSSPFRRPAARQRNIPRPGASRGSGRDCCQADSTCSGPARRWSRDPLRSCPTSAQPAPPYRPRQACR